MKRILTLFFVISIASGISAQRSKATRDISPMVKRMMDLRSCGPAVGDEVIIHRVLANMINTLDPSRLYFTQLDVDTVYSYAPMLSEELKGRETRFISYLKAMYQSRLERADSTASEALAKPFDYRKKESLEASDTIFAPDAPSLRSHWGRLLKYDCLVQMTNASWADSASPVQAAEAMKNETHARETLRKSMLRKIRRPLSGALGYDAWMENQFYDAICKAYDPHSSYFNTSAKEYFVGTVSGSSYLFGFKLDENEHSEVSISYLMPGSPAWRSGELNKGDVIISLRWLGENMIDLSGADIGDVEEVLSDQTHKDMELGIKKADGTYKLVWLQRQRIEDEDNFVKSYILDGKIKVGYIVLPGFYTEWESKNGKSCANDVAREVLKLKNENVESIVLDLRNNGGGSMGEAMQLAGIFIDEGVLAFAKGNTGHPYPLRDPNRGTVYDGPLIVMINKASASASEMVVGALQDYHRALIVGSPTYGKATIQAVLPADTTIDPDTYRESDGVHATDFVKVTTGRFYHVTGSTHQLYGIQPDIHLPDLTESARYGESYQHYPLRPDSVKRATYFTPLPPLPVQALAVKSHNRVAASPAFAVIDKYAAFLRRKHAAAESAIPLQYDEYMSSATRLYTESHALQDEFKKATRPELYAARHLTADAERMKLEKDKAEDYKKTIENIDKDIYIQECFSIITDYLQTLKK